MGVGGQSYMNLASRLKNGKEGQLVYECKRKKLGIFSAAPI